MTRIVGSVVVKDEVDRYLVPCIKWAQTFLDEIFVYDDRSTDGTAQVAADLGCRVVRRAEHKPSFLDHEGQFRLGAWHALERVMEITNDDWIFSFDADEFMVDKEKNDVRTALAKTINKAEHQGHVGVLLSFPEVFDVTDEGVPLVRTDGYWNDIVGSRLFKHQPYGFFNDKAMGCGSEPTFVSKGPLTRQNFGLHVLHYGYAKKEDQITKHERYSSLAEHGHDNSHVESIVTTPTLEPWTGPIPEGL